MGVFFEKSIEELYLDCITMTKDKNYCGKVVQLVKEADKRIFEYGFRPKLRLQLPNVKYIIGAVVDPNKTRIAVVLLYVNHAVFLHYVRAGDDYILKSAEVLNANIAATYNGPLPS